MLDLIIKEGRTLTGEPLEVGIQSGKIVLISSVINEPSRSVISAKETIISAGWIDSHVHCYEKMDLYYDFPDEIGIKKGVTTVIDAGTAGEKNIGDFYQLAQQAKTNVFALMNISEDGIVHQDELADLSKINQEKNLARLAQFPKFIVGIKARMSKTVVGDNGILPLKLAKELQKKAKGIPLMVHIGSAPPTLDEVLSLLESGDIVTHCYNGKPNGIMDKNEKVKPFVLDAYSRGILFDIGHGTDSFNFKVGKKSVQENFLCQTISTDIYHRNRENGPVFDLATTMEKALYLGISLENILKMVTENPAKNFHLTTKGVLEVGKDADLTLFKIKNKEKYLIDSNGNEAIVSKEIQPTMTIVGGKVYPVEEAKQ
ncbi:amidohydrolase/deacetylase family metallohydrolase [Enterococcus eurekensis]|uniref:Amidohydrolase/deacetylase family metallohydrolase n=1 Tax=Enterococcus eurekensis TaxID=1159753 RepID=A0ABV9M391_9ENTE